MSQKPEKPDESECCGSGCKPCIMDVYEEKLKKWELNQETRLDSKALSQSQYLPFLINSIKIMTDDTYEYIFQAVTFKNIIENKLLLKSCEVDYDILNSSLFFKMGEYLILKGCCIKDDELTTEILSRSYTPVLCRDDMQKGAFKIMVRLYPTGKMSGFLKKLNLSDIVFWRGPYEEFQYKINSHKYVLLIGGGTGIVPLYNIAKEIVENDEEETWVKMLASFKTVNSFILRTELNKLKQYWNFKLDVFITNQNDSNYNMSYNESFLLNERIDETVIHDEIKKCNNNEFLVVISGPNDFNKCMYGYALKNVVKENIFVFSYFFLLISFLENPFGSKSLIKVVIFNKKVQRLIFKILHNPF